MRTQQQHTAMRVRIKRAQKMLHKMQVESVFDNVGRLARWPELVSARVRWEKLDDTVYVRLTSFGARQLPSSDIVCDPSLTTSQLRRQFGSLLVMSRAVAA